MNSSGKDFWSIEANRWRLPYSERLNISALLQVFSNTSASYKYLFFLSLLDVLSETTFNHLVISLDDILLQMLASAWYPHTYFKLSFGVNDRIAEELDRLGLGEFSGGMGFGSDARSKLKARIASKDYTNNTLLNMVPYRLISPFFAPFMRGRKDTERNRLITELASEKFDLLRPFYCFSEDRQSIVMHTEWMLYFYDNLKLVQSFISWHWLDYMQRRNPSVPSIQMKLFPPATRNSLTVQTGFWRRVLEKESLNCIFSNKPLSKTNFSLDHFLPWSFVAHDQLWNLVPVSRSINTSKSNNLPSLKLYFTRFADIQFHGLSVYRKNLGKTSWKKITEPYLADLKIKPEDLFDRDKLYFGLKKTIEPLYYLAASQGFSEGWELERG
jgi:hypothetical protein